MQEEGSQDNDLPQGDQYAVLLLNCWVLQPTFIYPLRNYRSRHMLVSHLVTLCLDLACFCFFRLFGMRARFKGLAYEPADR
jgi:hypothetical protein